MLCNSLFSEPLPSAYIPKNERKDETPTVAAAMLNPNIARMMKIKEMSNKLKSTSSNATSNSTTAPSKEKHSPTETTNSKNSLDERVNATLDEITNAQHRQQQHQQQQDMQEQRLASQQKQTSNNLDVSRTPAATPTTTGAGTGARSSSDSSAVRRTSSMSYPEHLSTIRSPLPPRSPDPSATNQSDSNRSSLNRNRNVSYQVPNLPSENKHGKCRKITAQLIGRAFTIPQQKGK